MTLPRPERQPSRLTQNMLANLAGSGWSAAMNLIFVPLYLRLLGIEAVGLIGFYIALQGVLQVLDLGISPTMNREMARYSALPDKTAEARDLMRTVELAYWVLGICIGLALWAAAPLIAGRWIQPVAFTRASIQQVVRMMVVLAVVQWPLSLYQGGLMGLQRQTVANAISIVSSTIKNGGAAFVLWFLSPTITAFFEWQVVVAIVQVSVMVLLVWRFMPASGERARFRPRMIRSIGGFAAGLSGITFTAIIIGNLDKVILARSLSLTEFGYYTLAVQVASSLLLLSTPVFNAVFPRMSQLVAAKDGAGVQRLYHASSQLMASLLVPAGAFMAVFSYQLMLLWTGDATTAQRASPLVALLAVGMMINGLMNTTYSLQLAHGWVGLALAINIVWVVVLVPSVVLMSLRFGALGAAGVWAGLNTLYMLAGIPLTLRRFPRGETKRWLFEDTLPPAIAALGVVGLGHYLVDGAERSVSALVKLLLVGVTAVVTSGAVSPLVRRQVGSVIRSLQHSVR